MKLFKSILLHLLPVILVHLFGMFDGAQTVRKDRPGESIFWQHSNQDFHYLASKSYDESFRDSVRLGLVFAPESKKVVTVFDLRYIGGNKWYRPGDYFDADFWHLMKLHWIATIPMIALVCIYIGSKVGKSVIVTGWKLKHAWYLAYLGLGWIEGTSFTFYYHYAFIKGATFTYWLNEFLLGQHIYNY